MVASTAPFGSRPAHRGTGAPGRPEPRHAVRLVRTPGTASPPPVAAPSAVPRPPRMPLRVRALRGRWLGWGLIGGGVVLVPWIGMLASTLPSTKQVSNWSAAWVGLDVMLAAGLLGTGVLFTRRDARHGLLAAATGALLLADAWFDVMTATPGAERTVALALAAGLEVPLAVLCGVLAARAVPSVPSRPRGGAEGLGGGTERLSGMSTPR
ncbi:hypothetical protein [Actinomadura rubrisoli]|uniref:hypothetical protein n=1 Tax=Actinomadura rubrisoli TaxID=2530368 RepID=UPI001A9F6DF0|nr:hypothetical protein [Actinomadura rubrisoli]